MPGLHVNDLKSNVSSFARAYLFNVFFVTAPVAIVGGENIAAYLVRSTTLPESVIEPIVTPWQGQEYKFGSTHTFSEWTCTFNSDEESELRLNMEEWKRLVHDPTTNAHGSPDEYFGTVRIELLRVTGAPSMTYILNQAWPSTVGALDVAQDSKEVAQFDVTFTYNWHSYE